MPNIPLITISTLTLTLTLTITRYLKLLSPGGKIMSSRTSALRHMLANNYSKRAVDTMRAGLVRDGYRPSPLLPEGWMVRSLTDGKVAFLTPDYEGLKSVKQVIEYMRERNLAEEVVEAVTENFIKKRGGGTKGAGTRKKKAKQEQEPKKKKNNKKGSKKRKREERDMEEMEQEMVQELELEEEVGKETGDKSSGSMTKAVRIDLENIKVNTKENSFLAVYGKEVKERLKRAKWEREHDLPVGCSLAKIIS